MDNQMTNTLLYVSDEGAVSINVILDEKNETMWTTQKTMAELFHKDVKTISKHLNNIFDSEELVREEVTYNPNNSTNGRSLIITPGSKKQPLLYNLDAIISVGYRVNSKEATHFRRWATGVLKEYIIKGFALDDDYLKNGTRIGKDYFDELLERIRLIRSSERRFNQKITDLYSTSIDYNPSSDITREFFATVQNKLIYAVTNHTAAEIIKSRSDKDKINMGLTTWKNSPNGLILQSDVVISKNYLNEDELSQLDTLVDGFLTLAESRAKSHKTTTMASWKLLLDGYIELSQLPKLKDKGKVSSQEAKEHAIAMYNEYAIVQDRDLFTDFDQMILDIRRLEGGD